MKRTEDMTDIEHSAWHELKEIEQWYLEHDYIPNKITTGEWALTDERWLAYKAERIIKRQRKDTLQALLGI